MKYLDCDCHCHWDSTEATELPRRMNDHSDLKAWQCDGCSYWASLNPLPTGSVDFFFFCGPHLPLYCPMCGSRFTAIRTLTGALYEPKA